MNGSPLVRYAVAVLATVLAIAARLAADPVIGEEGLAYVTLFAALVFVGWYAGLGPALLTLVLGAVGAYFFLLPPGPLWTLERPYVAAWLLVYIVFGTACALLGHAIYRFHRRAEENGEAARDSEAMFAGMFGVTSVGMAQADLPTRRLVRVNPAFCALAGYSEDELLMMKVDELIHPEDRDWNRKVHEQLSVGGGYAVEKRYLRKDGSVVWVHATGNVLRDSTGRPTCAFAIVQDITARKQAEQALRESEERFRLIVESARDFAIIALDTEGNITNWNRGAENLLGYTAGEAVGQHSRLIFTPEDAAEGVPEQEIELALTEGRAVNERWHLRKDGTRFWGSGLVMQLRHNGDSPQGLVKIIRDRTEAQVAEERLRENEERYRTLASVLTDVPWTTDPHGRVVAPQPGWEACTGQTWNEYEGLGWIDAVHPDDRDQVRRRWREATENGTSYRSSGRIWHAPSQAYRYFDARATPVLNDDGSIREWVGSCADVHDQRLTQVALQDADRKKDEFLAMLAHELRNPLASIQYAAEVARLTAREAEEPLAVIGHQVEHLTHLIDDLLDVSRISRGRIELREEYVDAAEVVRHAVETARPLIDQRKHTLTLDVSTEAMPLYGDPTRLEQIVLNLLTNAAKYTPAGGKIMVSAAPEDGEVVFRVKDTGVGIPEEVLPSIFELFSQVDKSLARSQGGLGIGLSVVRTLVEMHGGSISATSPGPGEGSEFIVRLPLAKRETRPVRVDEPHAVVAGPHAKVLVIEDNASAANMLQMLLSSRGYTVEVAADGPEGLRRAEEFKPDIVLLDIGLPELDGYEVARRLRHQEATRQATIIGLSGYGQEADRERSREAGFDVHLTKPIGIEKLILHLTPRQEA